MTTVCKPLFFIDSHNNLALSMILFYFSYAEANDLLEARNGEDEEDWRREVDEEEDETSWIEAENEWRKQMEENINNQA